VNYQTVRSIVGVDYSETMKMVKYIKGKLSCAKYQDINKRLPQSVPSVYLKYRNMRRLSFDLRKRGGIKVYFWLPKRLKQGVARSFKIIPEKGTGWTGFKISDRQSLETSGALSAIIEYWQDCVAAIDQGEDTQLWKREELVKDLVRQCYLNTTILENKKFPDTKFKPDIVINSKKLVIQVDGAQHYRRVLRFHPTEADFLTQKLRDTQCDEICKRKRYTVLRVITDAAELLTEAEMKAIVTSIEGTCKVYFLVRNGGELECGDVSPLEGGV